MRTPVVGAGVVHRISHLNIPFRGRDALVRNKRASSHYKDLADLEALGQEPHDAA